MAQNSKIEWTDHTANLWHGCTKVHEGCDNCYAEVLSKRWGNDIWGNDKPRKLVISFFKDLDKYQELAKKNGEVHKVFVGSMMDIFEKPMPLVDNKGIEIVNLNTGQLRGMFFKRISENRYPNLMFLLLTKRPSNINKYIPEEWKSTPPSNVMFGTSPVNQETANKLILQLIDWVIQGGESGHKKRPFNLDWAYYLKQQCEQTKTPYFFKQIDKVQPIPEDLLIREMPVYEKD